jgi:ribosomal protein L37E
MNDSETMSASASDWFPTYPDETQATRKMRVSDIGSRCARCGSHSVAALPTFTVGSGTGIHPLPEEVICRRCSFIGLPVFLPPTPETEPTSP